MSTMETYGVRRGDFWFASLLHNLFLFGIFCLLVGILVLQCLPYMNNTQGMPVAVQPSILDQLNPNKPKNGQPSPTPASGSLAARSENGPLPEAMIGQERDIWDDTSSILQWAEGFGAQTTVTVTQVMTSQLPSKPSTSATKPTSVVTPSRSSPKPTTTSKQSGKTSMATTTKSDSSLAKPSVRPSMYMVNGTRIERFPIMVQLWIREQWRNFGFLDVLQNQRGGMDLRVADPDLSKPTNFEMNGTQIQWHGTGHMGKSHDDNLYTMDFDYVRPKAKTTPSKYHQIGMTTYGFEDHFYVDRHFNVGQISYYGGHDFVSFALCNTGILTLYWRDNSTNPDGSLWCKDARLMAGKN